jgi:hypothetical protein
MVQVQTGMVAPLLAASCAAAPGSSGADARGSSSEVLILTPCNRQQNFLLHWICGGGRGVERDIVLHNKKKKNRIVNLAI